ncbi:MAG TPA: hypothetical protein VMZ28_00665 [Kofleriaceae bacterium]|nr:hypothetical protein [Kofleriaceae bacterium]
MAAAPATIEMEVTRTACAGAAAAYLVRKLGKQSGTYNAPLVDRLLQDLNSNRQGEDLSMVAHWFAGRTSELARIGHRIGARLVAFRTATILDWVAAGAGHRGAVLMTSGELLHPGSGIEAPHAIAVTCDQTRRPGRDALMAMDPWPGMGKMSTLPATLEKAHKRCLNRAFLLYSYGWS